MAFIPKEKFASMTVIRNSQFRHLWIAQVCSQLAANIMVFLLALVVYQQTSSNTAVSGLFLAYGLPAVLFGFIAGSAVDRLDRRKVLLFCDISRAIFVGGLFFIVGNLPLVYLLVFLNSLITQLYIPSEAPLIPKLVHESQLLVANSLFAFTYYTSMGAGFILAGPLLRLFGTQQSLVVLSVLFLLAAISISRLRPEKDDTPSLRALLQKDLWYVLGRIAQDLHEGLTYIRKRLVLWDSLLLLTGTQITIVLLGTLGPGFADRMLTIDVRDASLVIIGPAVAGIVAGALWVANYGYKLGGPTLIRRGILSAGIILMLISLTVRLQSVVGLSWLFQDRVIFPLEMSLFFLLGVANSFLDVPANTILQREAQGPMRGRVYGTLAASVGGVGIIPVITGGILADTIGVGKVIFLLGLFVFAYGIFRMRYNNHRS